MFFVLFPLLFAPIFFFFFLFGFGTEYTCMLLYVYFFVFFFLFSPIFFFFFCSIKKRKETQKTSKTMKNFAIFLLFFLWFFVWFFLWDVEISSLSLYKEKCGVCGARIYICMGLSRQHQYIFPTPTFWLSLFFFMYLPEICQFASPPTLLFIICPHFSFF